jgi:hypothetical protein
MEVASVSIPGGYSTDMSLVAAFTRLNEKRTIFWRKRMVFSLRAFVYRVGRTKCTKLRSRVPRSSFKNFAIRPAS